MRGNLWVMGTLNKRGNGCSAVDSLVKVTEAVCCMCHSTMWGVSYSSGMQYVSARVLCKSHSVKLLQALDFAGNTAHCFAEPGGALYRDAGYGGVWAAGCSAYARAAVQHKCGAAGASVGAIPTTTSSPCSSDVRRHSDGITYASVGSLGSVAAIKSGRPDVAAATSCSPAAAQKAARGAVAMRARTRP